MSNIWDSKWLRTCWGLAFIVVVVITSIQLNSFNRKLYQQTYTKFETAKTIGITNQALADSTEVLLDYLDDHRSDLKIQVVQHNQSKNMFNELEIAHMEDVKSLYHCALWVRNSLVVFWLVIAIGFLNARRQTFLDIMRLGYQEALKIFGIILGIIGLFVMINFDGFWTLFHKIVFRNDLWLLNPETDNLILMVPLEFFQTLVIRIIFWIVLVLLIVEITLIFLSRKKKQAHLNVVLYEPEIPQNAGNIIRTCMASGCTLHIIEPTGFIWDDKRLKRSGMDYKEHTEVIFHDNWEAFQKQVKGECFYVTRYGQRPHSSFDFRNKKDNIYLVFGKESTGIPLDILYQNKSHCMRIPMEKEARSLNLSNCVALCVYEVLRQQDYPNLSTVEVQKGADWLDVNNQ